MDNFDLKKYLAENELLKEDKISFGPFQNVPYYLRKDLDKIFLNVIDSDNFKKIEDELIDSDPNHPDSYSEEEIEFLNNTSDELSIKMSSYLTSLEINNEILNNPIGYGQEIENLVVSIKPEDLFYVK